MNDHILKEALQCLPQYQPPAMVWEEIEAALETDDMIAGSVGELPTYTPPALIWENIAAGLDQAPQKRPVFRMLLSTRTLMAAASLALLLTAAWWILGPKHTLPAEMAAITPENTNTPETAASSPENKTSPAIITPATGNKNTIRKTKTPQHDVVISQQIVDNQLMEVCREQDNQAFELVQNLCREQMPVCKNPEFKNLKTELDELTAAQNELRQALGQYADDPELVAQIIRIEHERTSILQQIIQLI
jgi:hypothetical protein